jgi:hypothetical protein
MEIFWELYQRKQIRDLQDQAGRAASGVRSVGRQGESLESKMEALILLNEALLEIAVSKLGITREEVLAKAVEIDSRDGARDGKMTTAAAKCGQCSRPLNSRRSKCQYCGTERGDADTISRIVP